MKKSIILIFLLCGTIQIQALTLENDYIRFTVDDITHQVGSFRTTGGDADIRSDDGHFILHQKDRRLNFTIVSIEGKAYKLELSGKPVAPPKMEKGIIISEWTLQNVRIRRTIKIVEGGPSGRPDTIQLDYSIINQDASTRDIGIKLVFDTYIGKSDDIPFLLPARGITMTERKVTRVPEFFLGLDDLNDPYVQFQATLSGEGLTPPDYIIFANPDKLSSQYWDVEIEEGKSFQNPDNGLSDTGYALYWDPIGFAGAGKKGSENTISTRMGLYNSSRYKGEYMTLSFGCARQISSGLFTVVALVQNHDTAKTLSDLQIKFEPPEGAEILTSIKEEITLKELPPTDIRFLYYIMKVKSLPEGEYSMSFTVTGKMKDYITVSKVSRTVKK